MTTLEVLFTPAEFELLKQRDLKDTVCVVFDVLRATTTMVTALANGAAAIIPVEEISEAVVMREKNPGVLLAGERDGVRISEGLTGGTRFDLGNSPREFNRSAVLGRTIVMTTTNGTRALRACAHARTVLAGSFLNLRATVDFIRERRAARVLLICGGTFDQAAYEDALAAGAVCERIWPPLSAGVADSALIARDLFQRAENDLPGALARSRNGMRLLGRPELQDDVAFCAQRDVWDLVAELGKDGLIRSCAG